MFSAYCLPINRFLQVEGYFDFTNMQRFRRTIMKCGNIEIVIYYGVQLISNDLFLVYLNSSKMLFNMCI